MQVSPFFFFWFGTHSGAAALRPHSLPYYAHGISWACYRQIRAFEMARHGKHVRKAIHPQLRYGVQAHHTLPIDVTKYASRWRIADLFNIE